MHAFTAALQLATKYHTIYIYSNATICGKMNIEPLPGSSSTVEQPPIQHLPGSPQGVPPPARARGAATPEWRWCARTIQGVAGAAPQAGHGAIKGPDAPKTPGPSKEGPQGERRRRSCHRWACAAALGRQSRYEEGGARVLLPADPRAARDTYSGVPSGVTANRSGQLSKNRRSWRSRMEKGHRAEEGVGHYIDESSFSR